VPVKSMMSLFNHTCLLGWLEAGFLDGIDLSSNMGNTSLGQSLDQTVKNTVNALDSGTGSGSVLYT
jgi:hypothetical protein